MLGAQFVEWVSRFACEVAAAQINSDRCTNAGF